MASQDKTEKATPQKLREARQRGDVATSPEATGAMMIVVSLLALQQQGGHVMDGLLGVIQRDIAIAGNPSSLSAATTSGYLRSEMAGGLLLLLPLCVAAVAGAMVAGALNTRGVLTLKGISPSFRKLNPLQNTKHLFGKESLILLIKVIAKLAVVVLILRGWVGTWQMQLPMLSFTSNTPTGVPAAAGTLWDDVLHISLQIAAGFFLIGAIDFGYRQYAWRKRLRMTKEEVKEEAKRMEGNLQMRARMRQTARKRLRALMAAGGLRKVPQADVVVTNPTHFAIAIQYKAGKMRAPKVIAKGQRLFALRIKEIARQHNIPIVENKPLAQTLYKSVEINQEIPSELYQAVAQVLAFVYRLRAPRAMRRPAPATAARMSGKHPRAGTRADLISRFASYGKQGRSSSNDLPNGGKWANGGLR